MTKNRLKLSIAAAMMITTCSNAGTVTAPNVDNIELSGDMEFKYIKEKSDTETINKRTAEINLNLDATVADVLNVYTSFQAYDDNQANANADKTLDITHAYAELPIMEGKGKVVAGLVPNFSYGTDAFNNGGEAWKVAVAAPVAKGVIVQIVSKIENEEEQDSNKGDSGATAIRIDAKVGDFMLGAKYANGYKNKGDGFTGTPDTELKAKVFMAYATGLITGVDVGFEYAIKDIKKVGATLAQQFKDDQKGYFITASKDVVDGFNIGLSYINLSKGMKGGDDFSPALIFEKEAIASSTTQNTTALIVPLSYSINDSLIVNTTYVDANLKGVDAKEFDLGVEYEFNKNVTLSATYGNFDGEINCAINDTKNFEIALAITF